ncbi:hypothetical protein [Agrobacterium vitis]|uniref:hypothetical protein n=2 Tax=Agrobacterium vitis TaxID=373 RepID=UPI00087235B1|nr:hypothetical protein [Agrobacterium vitis]MCM2470929.1 hypothetical protein [Agrobacterium vitis]MUO70079.1 hypothetical protein [Agrobacterium vitis]
MTNLIVIVNGYPQSGKDTATGFLIEAMTEMAWSCARFSIIDPVRDFLFRIGVRCIDKTPEQRKLMADIMDRLEAHDHALSMNVLERIEGHLSQDTYLNRVAFLHVRQISAINWIKQTASNTMVTTLGIERTGTEQGLSNAADSGVWDYHYDCVIGNNGSLSELQSSCRAIAEFLDLEARR